jgi:hypothetical protein
MESANLEEWRERVRSRWQAADCSSGGDVVRRSTDTSAFVPSSAKMAAEADLDASAIVRSRRRTLSVAFDDERVASWAANEVMRRRASR